MWTEGKHLLGIRNIVLSKILGLMISLVVSGVRLSIIEDKVSQSRMEVGIGMSTRFWTNLEVHWNHRDVKICGSKDNELFLSTS